MLEDTTSIENCRVDDKGSEQVLVYVESASFHREGTFLTTPTSLLLPKTQRFTGCGLDNESFHEYKMYVVQTFTWQLLTRTFNIAQLEKNQQYDGVNGADGCDSCKKMENIVGHDIRSFFHTDFSSAHDLSSIKTVQSFVPLWG